VTNLTAGPAGHRTGACLVHLSCQALPGTGGSDPRSPHGRTGSSTLLSRSSKPPPQPEHGSSRPICRTNTCNQLAFTCLNGVDAGCFKPQECPVSLATRDFPWNNNIALPPEQGSKAGCSLAASSGEVPTIPPPSPSLCGDPTCFAHTFPGGQGRTRVQTLALLWDTGSHPAGDGCKPNSRCSSMSFSDSVDWAL